MIKKSHHINAGFSMIEALIAVSLLFFIMVSVIAAFANQLTVNRRSDQKSIAMELAETQVEDLLKFTAASIPSIVADKYYRVTAHNVVELDASPNEKNQMRRSVNLSWMGNQAIIRVTVEYGYTGTVYKGRVTIRTTRAGR